MLLISSKGHGSSDTQDLVFQNFPDGFSLRVVIGVWWHHWKALRVVLFDGETSWCRINRFQMFLYANWAWFWIVKLFFYAWQGDSAWFLLDSCKYWSAPEFYVCGAGGKSPALVFFPLLAYLKVTALLYCLLYHRTLMLGLVNSAGDWDRNSG